MSETAILIGLTSIVVLGVSVQWAAWRLRIPSILLLLAAGFLVGPVTGMLDPNAIFGSMLLPVVSLSVALILFEGALSLRVSELAEAGRVIRNMVTIGALVTWLLSSIAAKVLLGFPLPTALLLGAILVVTGPTVVGPILRQVRPVGRVGPIAKWEGIVIDPIGAVLAVLVFDAIEAAHSAGVGEAAWEVVTSLLGTMAAGAVMSVLGAALMIVCLRRFWIPDFLQSPVLLMVVVATFTLSNLVQPESGLLAVTLLGIILANQKSITVGHLVEFKENLRVLLIATLFIVLAARVRLEESQALGWWSLAFLTFLILVVRPLSVLASTVRSGLSWQERVFLSWLAPRGIVAASFVSVFALRSSELGGDIVAVTFLVITGTVLVYGLSIGPVARRLGLATPNPQGMVIAGANSLARALASALHSAGYKVLLVDSNRDSVNAARMEGLPTCYGSILSEPVSDTMDLGGIGRFLALTPNDEVNSLAAWHFREMFGRAGVYQLTPPSPHSARTETASHHLRGRLLFDKEATYARLQSRIARGAVVKATPLTEEFDYEAFQSHYGGNAVCLFLIGESGDLTICTAADAPAPQPGHTLISLVDPVENSEP
ncbi:MAG: sodium:proton antiporter [Planctomycetota bacterium]